MRFKQMVASLAIVCILQPIDVPRSNDLPNSIYLQQQSSNSCTLAAAAMMVRRYLYHQNARWDLITENTLKGQAWSLDGLLWHWQWSDDENLITVEHSSFNNFDVKNIKQLLMDHPEGILFYCGGDIHHGVLITKVNGHTVYCADPAIGYSGKEIRLVDSLLGNRLGTQENILRNGTAVWCIISAEDKEPYSDCIV